MRVSVTALGATLSLCDAPASQNDLVAQPRALKFGKQPDPFDVLAKHCTSEVYTKKKYGSPTTFGSSEYCNVFSTKYLYIQEQADIGQILGTLKAEILAYILSI